MFQFEKNINHSLIRPKYEDYRCKKKDCTCSTSEMCTGRWNKYAKDLSQHIYLKFKDTYKNGD
jgi:hypothetical protein